MRYLTVLLCFILLSASTFKRKDFPLISYTTNQGETFSNENFKDKKTIVVLFHIGCPAAMMLLKDLESVPADKNLQIVGILENTPEQIRQFNDTAKTTWSSIRKHFKIMPVKIPLIAECDTENIEITKSGNTLIKSQCSILSKKLKAKASPAIFYVDEAGKIIKKKIGYLGTDDLAQRLNYLYDVFKS
jgi:thioredoxin-related protein